METVRIDNRPAEVEVRLAPVFGLPGPQTLHVRFLDTGERAIVDAAEVERDK